MSEYKGIKGFQVQTRTEDPTPYAQALADNPYAGAWASGGSLNTARNHVGGAGISNNSALAVGGSVSPRAQTENYNGSSWTEVNDLNNGRTYADCAGTATAALAIGGAGGSTPATAGYVESWDGTNWTEVADLLRGPASPQSTVYGMASGIQTSALYYGGDEGSTNVLARTESWNGSAWTEVNDLNQARSYGGGIGTSNTSALCVSGLNWNPGSSTNDTSNEQWNGSSWTELAEPNQGRGFLGSGNYGSVTSALIFGGRNQGPSALISATESWNGSAWTEVADLATARLNAASGSGTATAAMFAGGGTPSVTNVAEEWSFSGLDPSTTPSADYSNAIIGDFYYNSTTGQFKNISAGSDSWASGGNMNTGRGSLAPAVSGTQTAALAFGGYTSGPLPSAIRAETEKYDGTSWTEVGDLNTAKYQLSGAGIQTAALKFGGAPATAATEQWDNSSWTEVNDLNTARYGLTGLGLYTAALAVGGNPGPAQLAITESWDGTNWTEVNDLNTVRGEHFMAGGTQTSGIIAFGQINPGGPSTKTSKTELWDGTSWTEVNDGNTARSNLAGCGTQTDGLAFAGLIPPATGATEKWNGTTWTETSDLSTARDAIGGAGTRSSGIAFGGNTSPKQQTEEFTSTDFAIKTVTTS